MAQPLQTFDLGRTLGQAQNIVNARTQNELARQELNPNSLNNRYKQAQINALNYKTQNPGSDAKYGKQIQYAMDDDGKTLRGFTVGDDGSLKELPLPEGMTWADTYSLSDMGAYKAIFGSRTGFQGGPPESPPANPDLTDIPSLNVTGQAPLNPFASVKKTLPPQNTPEHLAAVEAAKTTAGIQAQLGGGGGPSAGDVESDKVLKKATAEIIVQAENQIGVMLQANYNYDQAIKLAEAGANTGPIVKMWPSVRKETIAMEQLQKEMQLDVIGAVTLGAISKDELILTEQKALPTDLDDPDLIEWARGKIEANRKLMGYFLKQAQFLRSGGTPAQWMEMVNQKGGINAASGGLKKPAFVSDQEWNNLTPAQQRQLAE